MCCSASQLNAQVHERRITQSFTEPIEKCVAASAESGVVANAHVKEGDRVRVGDALASINHNVIKKSLAIAVAKAESTARFDAAKSQLQLIESQLEAINSLVSGGHTNKYEVQQKKAEHQQAIAELRAAQDELKLAALEVNRIKAQIDDRIIKSPIDGFVTEIHKQPGENVSQNEPMYATIVRVDQLKVRFYLDAATLRSAKVGQRVALAIGKRKSSAEGTISFVSPVIDPDSGLGRLDVVIENRNLAIQSGIVCYWQQENSAVAGLRNQVR
jgi:RND family efflux transporter MFP subunit